MVHKGEAPQRSNLIAKAGAFELHRGGTPMGFVVRTVGFRRNYYSILFDGDRIVSSAHSNQLRSFAPHIHKLAEQYLKSHAAGSRTSEDKAHAADS